MLKKVFLKISQNSPENSCSLRLANFVKKETLSQVLSCEFCEISKNTFSYRTSPVAASANHEMFLVTMLLKVS